MTRWAGAGLLVVLLVTPPGIALAGCQDPPVPKVNWQGCNTDLEGARLANASLIGANLQGANLKAAFVRGAKLARANLKDARLDGVNLAGINLSGATWIDGKVCAPQSIGACNK